MGKSLITPGENNQVADDHYWLTRPTSISVCVCVCMHVCIYSIWEVTLSIWVKISSIQLLSRVWLFVTPWITAHQASLSINNSWSSPNSCPSSRWCHPAISSSVVPFSSCPQSFPAAESFPMGQLFTWGSQSIGVSASTSDLPMNTQDWPPLEWTGWTARDSQESSPTPQFKSINSLVLSFLHSPTLTSIHDHWKNHSLD